MFPPMSDMPMFKKRFINSNSRFASHNGLTLPSSPQMTKSDIKTVSIEIINYLKNL